MASKRKSRRTGRKAASTAQERTLQMLHEVWLAGLGAVSKAQRGAPKLLDDLISEGARVDVQARNAARAALGDLVGGVRMQVQSRVGQMRGQANEALEGLERIFQTRVHRALTQIGVPSAEEVTALSRRVDTLNASVERLARSRKASARPTRHSAARGATHPAAPAP